MADVAAIFHWPPSAFNGLDVADLMMWRHLAIERAKLINGAGKDDK